MTDYIHTVNDIGVAVDVGSTSIAVCCIDLCHKTEILSFSFTNPQHIYGADVVTRIKHCIENREKLHEMHVLVENMLSEKLHQHLGEQYYNITEIVYSGNTTMLHILRELSLDGFATAPFSPIDIEYAQEKTTELDTHFLRGNGNADITYIYLPGFSAFVGADILAGAGILQMGQKESYDLLIDLGTNGEMLLLNREKGFATSTACGLVFDNVINGAKYGSDSIHALANCVKRGLIDHSGKFADALFEKGITIDKNFTIRQENVRNFQLAKGAIYAGIQCLLHKAEINAYKVAKVYISGGLGFYMNKRDAFILKMLPKEFTDKIIISGNTSLEGAKQFVMTSDKERERTIKMYEDIKQKTLSFELANYEGFQDCYLQSLDF